MNKQKSNKNNLDGYVKIPIKNGQPMFDEATGKVGERTLSNERVLGIFTLGAQHFQTKVTARQLVIEEDK